MQFLASGLKLSPELMALIGQYGYLAIFLIVAIEGTGLPGPVQLVIIAAGYLVSLGKMDFWTAGLLIAVANSVGNLGGYALGRFGGRPLVSRWGRWFGITEERLARLDRWMHRYGPKAVFVGRWFGPLRTPAILTSGISRVPVAGFTWWSWLGSLTWSFGYLLLWTKLGDEMRIWIPGLMQNTEYVILIGLSMLLLTAAGFWYAYRCVATAKNRHQDH
ncbi:MAG: DedA family protein [Bacillota bacterium]